jgi:general secretion pathway protein E/type IV pilus assembly protein PilB
MGIGEILIRRGHVSQQVLAEMEALRRKSGQRLDRLLVEQSKCTEEQVLSALSEHLGLPMVSLADYQIDTGVLGLLPARVVFRRTLMPLQRINGALRVATCDPFDLYALDEVRLMTGLEVEPVLACREEIEKLIKAHYGLGGETIDALMDSTDLNAPAGDTQSDDLLDQAEEASVIKLVNEFFLEALKERASDIHIEPYERQLKIRYRIDGVLQETAVPPQIQRFQAAIISRIKIMANMNIAEKRLPQDGRIKLQVGGRQVDIRVSVIPLLHGEGVVMRLLDKSSTMFTLKQLGMRADTLDVFHQVIKRPHGILLVTGPTGAGKTTTLYAALHEIVSSEIKVLTVEDPVEYHLDGVNQIQTQSKIGLTFGRALRHILRHDPDVIMIGEIRDLETAEAAVQASLTGHLVLSTLHTNDACSSATRLLDMGVEPFLVTSTLEAAMAQRLVRTICPDCREAYQPDRNSLPRDFALQEGQMLYRGKGCRKCRNTGYFGRTGLFELMLISDAIRDRIMTRSPADHIVTVAQKEGLRLLRQDGWLKVSEGITTPEEVIRATKA